MTDEETLRKIEAAILAVSGRDALDRPISVELKLVEDLGLDSMTQVSLMFFLQEVLGFDFEEHAERIGRVSTVGDIAKLYQEFQHAA
ncbi:MAG: hypothetical protein AAGJ87_11905 [Pseudomonadota bacterium]